MLGNWCLLWVCRRAPGYTGCLWRNVTRTHSGGYKMSPGLWAGPGHTGRGQDTGWVHRLAVGLQDELRDTGWPWGCRRGCGLWTWALTEHRVSSGHLGSCGEIGLQAGDDEKVRGLQTTAPKD